MALSILEDIDSVLLHRKQVIIDEIFLKLVFIRIAGILKTYAPNGAVIFATTTPPDADMPGHDMDRLKAYNAAAVAALSPMGILINDLFTPVAEDIDRMISEDYLHASPYGVEILANRVADCIKKNA